MAPIVALVALFVAVPVVVTPVVAVTDIKNDNHNFRKLCVLAEGKYDDTMLGTCKDGQWLNVYVNLYNAAN